MTATTIWYDLSSATVVSGLCLDTPHDCVGCYPLLPLLTLYVKRYRYEWCALEHPTWLYWILPIIVIVGIICQALLLWVVCAWSSHMTVWDATHHCYHRYYMSSPTVVSGVRLDIPHDCGMLTIVTVVDIIGQALPLWVVCAWISHMTVWDAILTYPYRRWYYRLSATIVSRMRLDIPHECLGCYPSL